MEGHAGLTPHDCRGSILNIPTILTEHGGAITMDSEPHHGARCTLRFPLLHQTIAQDENLTALVLDGQQSIEGKP